MTSDQIELLYKQHVAELLNATSITKDDIFELFNGVPLESELKRLFSFYYKELKENIEIDLEPSFIFIKSDNAVNAFAMFDKRVNVIGINVGTFHHLHSIFKKNKVLNDKLKIRFPKFPANDIMYETAMHFTFYHELGHLIQKSSFLQKKLAENVQGQFSLKRHILEIDADEFSAVIIATHITQFSIEKLGDKILQNDIEDVLISICTSILFYLLSFSSSKKEMYYEECSHPHPLIRMININFVIINHYQSSLLTYGVDLNIDSEKIIIETMNLAEEINDEFFPNDRLIIMKNTIFNNRDDIFDYWDYLKDQKLGDKEMATYKWNTYAKSKLKSDG